MEKTFREIGEKTMIKLKDLLTEAKFKKKYSSIKDMRRAYDKIISGGHPRVRVTSWSEVEKTGIRKISYIEISGDKIWVDAYKKIAFNGGGSKGDVIKYVREKTGNENA